MNLSNVTKALGRVRLTAIKHSPELLLITGVVAVVAGTVMACKATLKVDDILDDHKEAMDKVHEGKKMIEEGTVPEDKEYTEQDNVIDTVKVYRDTTIAMVKTYGPSVVVGGLGIASILSGFGILRSRYIALGAAYTALESCFKKYRHRVVEHYGKDGSIMDRHFMYGTKVESVDVVTKDDNGKKKKEKVLQETIDIECFDGYSPYAKIFEASNPNYQKDPSLNRWFIQEQEKYATNLLRTRGYLFLNEVYKNLGFEPTQVGQIAGWVYDKSSENEGDNAVDFGLFDTSKSANVRFVNGLEDTIILDFNVQGNILNLTPMQAV